MYRMDFWMSEELEVVLEDGRPKEILAAILQSPSRFVYRTRESAVEAILPSARENWIDVYGYDGENGPEIDPDDDVSMVLVDDGNGDYRIMKNGHRPKDPALGWAKVTELEWKD